MLVLVPAQGVRWDMVWLGKVCPTKHSVLVNVTSDYQMLW